MDKSLLANRISGCYVPIPTLFRDGDLELPMLHAARREGDARLPAAGRSEQGALFLIG